MAALRDQDSRRGADWIQPDIAWIEPGFALGCRPFAAQRAAIRELGIDAVVTVHEPSDDEHAAWHELGVEHHAFPTRDQVQIPARQLNQVARAVLHARQQGKTVLLHCLAGINRAPTYAAAVLRLRDGLDADEAVRRVRAQRPNASPTPEQLQSLRDWSRHHRAGSVPR